MATLSRRFSRDLGMIDMQLTNLMLEVFTVSSIPCC